MATEKNLYDYTSEELKIKMNEDFEKDYSKYYYSEENWIEINNILNEFNEMINQTGYPFALYNETKFKLAHVPSLKKDRPVAEKIFDNILNVFRKVGNTATAVWNTIKFTFSIFALTFSSVALTLFIHLILGTFIYGILPKQVTPLMLQSFISAILFIVFKVLLFLDKDDKDVQNNYKIEIVKFSLTIPFYCAVFCIFLLLEKIPVLEEIVPIFYPHMWLSAFTNEFVYSPMIALSINCLISIVIYLIIRKKYEY